MEDEWEESSCEKDTQDKYIESHNLDPLVMDPLSGNRFNTEKRARVSEMTIKKHTISRDSNQGEQSFLRKLGHQGRKARTEMSLKGKHYAKEGGRPKV